MAKDKKGFILYADQKELIDALSNDKAGRLIKHIFAYVNDENPKTDDPLIKMAFIPIKQQFKRDLKQWADTKHVRSEAGKKGAIARWENNGKNIAKNGKRILPMAKMAVNVNVNDNVNVNVKENVILKETEISTLKDKHGLKGYEWMVDKLSNYKLSSGKKYVSDYGAINSWVTKEWKKVVPSQNKSYGWIAQ